MPKTAAQQLTRLQAITSLAAAVLTALYGRTEPTHVHGFTMLDTTLSYARSHWLTSLFVSNVTTNIGITSIQDPALLATGARLSCPSRAPSV